MINPLLGQDRNRVLSMVGACGTREDKYLNVWSGQISLKLACTQMFCKHSAIVIPVLKQPYHMIH
ncbi:hypothetical protein DPMN_111815 [Dreissena polymorpha]|uniref:Uncharacterized protein n=1 Tax=Dreissena polymorpha TaxID=45954 RepID=A0A9D4KFX0_DREPO|nr:hypothetical protein DPMN_111815 [Dreissena polymorpha]